MVLGLAAAFLLGNAPVAAIRLTVLPESAPCSADGLAAAFRSRLGQVTVVSGLQPSAAVNRELQVAVRQSANGLQLRVRAPGKRELVRELPEPGNDCLAPSETAALIVERYLDELQVGNEVPSLSLTSLRPTEPGKRWGIAVEAALTVELVVLPQPGPGQPTTIPLVGVGGSLGIGVRRGPWQLAVRGVLEPAGSKAVTGALAGGDLHTWAAAASVVGTYLLSAGPGAIRFELQPGVQLYVGSTSTSSGAQFGKPESGIRTLPFIGASVGYELPLWKHLSALATLSMRVHLGTAQLEVEDVPADTVYTRLVDGEGSLGLGYVFY